MIKLMVILNSNVKLKYLRSQLQNDQIVNNWESPVVWSNLYLWRTHSVTNCGESGYECESCGNILQDQMHKP
jgi:transposase-like protein